MPPHGWAIPRHLIFVLESGEVVIQRGASLVELLETREQRAFSDFDHDHSVTDAELQDLMEQDFILGFDEMSVWLAEGASQGSILYHYLDTKLSPMYLQMVTNLLQSAALSDQYAAKVRMDRVAIMGPAGEPFINLLDAEDALMLIQQALGSKLAGLSIESIEVNPRADETQVMPQPNFDDLIRETPVSTLADRTILIIEDGTELENNPIQLALENLGMELRVAHDGETALEILMDEEPDVVLIDLTLPDMHGYEVIAKIKKDPITSKTPIIAMSQHITETDIVFALHVAKVDDFLPKPISPNLLRHKITNLVNRR